MKRGLLMKNIKLTIQYDGTRYQGWQKPGKKGNSNTISGKLTEVISRITDEETTLFAGAKTDTNVHADAQIVNFKTKTTLSALKLKQELNHYLPQDIAIISAEEVSERFHASLNAQTITYLYRVSCAPVADVFTRKYKYHLPDTLDLNAMQHASEQLLGRHDFKHFSSGKTKKSTEKDLLSIEIFNGFHIPKDLLLKWEQPSDADFLFLLKGNDFLHQMPLYLTETLLEIGLGSRNASSIPLIFSGEDTVSKRCPSHGLFLHEITYK